MASYLRARWLLLALFLIVGLATIGVVHHGPEKDRDHFFIVLIFCAGLALLLSATLSSEALIGYDIHQEYYVYNQVVSQGVWRPEVSLLYDSTLSVTILPAIIHSVTGLDGVAIFKLVYPLLFSLVPIVLYKVFRRILSPENAFLSVFLFLSYPTFYEEMIAVARQEVAELFFVVLLWFLLWFAKRAHEKSHTIVVVILTFGLVTAHYSLAYIYVSLLAASLAISWITRRTLPLVTAGSFIFSALLAALWYLFTAGGVALASLYLFSSFVFNGLIRDFFNPGSRPNIVLQALGFGAVTPGILHDANRVTQYLVLIALIFGFLVFTFSRNKSALERKITPLTIVAFGMLGSTVILPFFAAGLNLSRIYHIALMIIAPCFVYGVGFFISTVRRLSSVIGVRSSHMSLSHRIKPIVAAGILCSYFLFVSGWMWAVTSDRPTSITLDRERLLTYPSEPLRVSYFSEFTDPRDIFAARWLSSQTSNSNLVCADYTSRQHVLTSYGGFSPFGPTIPSDCRDSKALLYLSVLNSYYGLGTQTSRYVVWHVSDMSASLVSMNRIYSGGAEIYTRSS